MNFTALEMPYSDAKAWFTTHLHTDHVGDFAQVWVASWVGGRLEPLEMYGPSGLEPKYGFKHFAEKQIDLMPGIRIHVWVHCLRLVLKLMFMNLII